MYAVDHKWAGRWIMWERTAEERKKRPDLPKKYLETISVDAALDDSYESVVVVRMEKRRKKSHHMHIVEADYMGVVRDVVQTVCKLHNLPDEWQEHPEVGKLNMSDSDSDYRGSDSESE